MIDLGTWDSMTDTTLKRFNDVGKLSNAEAKKQIAKKRFIKFCWYLGIPAMILCFIWLVALFVFWLFPEYRPVVVVPANQPVIDCEALPSVTPAITPNNGLNPSVTVPSSTETGNDGVADTPVEETLETGITEPIPEVIQDSEPSYTLEDGTPIDLGLTDNGFIEVLQEESELPNEVSPSLSADCAFVRISDGVTSMLCGGKEITTIEHGFTDSEQGSIHDHFPKVIKS